MLNIIGGLLGIALGLIMARRRGGNRLDMAQYAAGFGIALGLVGLFVSIFVERMV